MMKIIKNFAIIYSAIKDDKISIDFLTLEFLLC